jgi:hypothetical protein
LSFIETFSRKPDWPLPTVSDSAVAAPTGTPAAESPAVIVQPMTVAQAIKDFQIPYGYQSYFAVEKADRKKRYIVRADVDLEVAYITTIVEEGGETISRDSTDYDLTKEGSIEQFKKDAFGVIDPRKKFVYRMGAGFDDEKLPADELVIIRSNIREFAKALKRIASEP